MEKNNKIESKDNLINILFYIFLMFPLLCENIIGNVFGSTISKLFCVLSCAVILFLILVQKSRIKIGIFEISIIILILLRCIILFFLAPDNLVITTKNNMITPYGLVAYSMMFLLISCNLNNKEKLKNIFAAMFYVISIGIFMNIIFNGDLSLANNFNVLKEAIKTGYTNSKTWLFGHRNMIFIHHLIWMVTGFVSCKLKNKSYTKLFVFQMIITMLVGILSWNSTMMIATILLLVLYVLRNFSLIKIVYNNYLLIYLFLEIGIVFFKMQKAFSFIIVDIFHRNLSFTGRTTIWQYYIDQFVDSSWINKLIGNYGVTDLTVNSHNMFLGLLSFTGIIGLLFYIVLLYISQLNLKKEKNTEMSKFISIIIFTFLINSLTMEFYVQPLMAVYLGYIVKKLNNITGKGVTDEKS